MVPLNRSVRPCGVAMVNPVEAISPNWRFPSPVTEPTVVQRFKQERQILAGLDHPNIARILDGGNTADGRPFYVMEYVAGSAIDDYCDRVKPDVSTRVGMIIEVCQALEYLHGHAIAHREGKIRFRRRGLVHRS